MSDRGEYRTLFVSFADDTDAHALSGIAFKLLVMLKLSLPITGIGVIYPSKLCDQVGCDRARLEEAMAELERPKPGRELGWIVRENNVVWIVNALLFDVSLTPANVKKHVPYVRKLVNQLNFKLKIVQQFKAFYPQWFQQDALGNTKGSDTLSKPRAEQEHDLNKSKSLTKQERSGDLDPEGSGDADRSAAAVPLADALAQLPKGALDFLREFYGRGKASTERRTDVARQLVATLNGGADFNGAKIRAGSIERLVEKCRDVVRKGVRNPDRAIVVLLTKLNDTADVTERAAAVAKSERVDEERATEVDYARAEQWLAEHPEVEAAIEEQLEAQHLDRTSVGDDPFATLSRTMARRAYVLTAWRTAGAPEVVHA